MSAMTGRPMAGGVTARRALGAFFGVLARRRAYLAVCYLLATLPLGVFYFIVLVVGLSAGLPMLFAFGLGALVLLAMHWVWWRCAHFERALVIWWLDVPIPPMGDPPTALRFRERLDAHLRNPVTWKSLLYLIVEFPFGIFAFSLTLVLVSLSLTLVLMPLVYMAYTAVYAALGGVGDLVMVHVIFPIHVDGHIRPVSLAESLVVTPLGVVVGAGALWLLDTLAQGWGQFARVMLGMSEAERRIREARATAARATATAQRAEQQRRELVVNVSHELRTPIASIRGHVESLLMPEEERPPEVDQQEYLRIIEREAERLSALVDDLLAVARAEANELRLDVRAVPVEAVIEEVYQALAPLAKRQREVTLVRRVAPGLPPIWADRARLAQVLLNLLRNAITYTPQGGIVSLSAERGNDWWVTVSVADTGIGIPRDELPRIFERFYRTDASRSRASGGFGLGLSIAKDLVQGMGGGIAVESAEGTGTTFRVTLRATAPVPREELTAENAENAEAGEITTEDTEVSEGGREDSEGGREDSEGGREEIHHGGHGDHGGRRA